jgi:hypothetical protein
MMSEELANQVSWMGNVILVDSSYNLPTRRWIEKEFNPFFHKWLFNHNVGDWTPTWDCDDFACMYRTLASVCHSTTFRLGRSEGLAIGEVYCRTGNILARPSTFKNHAFNAALTDEGLVFIEPQLPEIFEITEEQRDGIWFARF